MLQRGMKNLKALEAFAKNVKLLRTKRELTLEEMGTLLGVTRQRAWSLENGKTFASTKSLARLAKIFKVEETDLFDPSLENRLK